MATTALKPTAAFARADHRGSLGKALINCSAIRHKKRQAPKRGSAPFLETLRYQADAWSGRICYSSQKAASPEKGKRTVPGDTAIPGRCVEWTEQAPAPAP